jgi:hypothetical protein|tara:strand:- start:405 stop:539 length:135 start_codon:yes stop_codon:yes gene_type:complete
VPGNQKLIIGAEWNYNISVFSFLFWFEKSFYYRQKIKMLLKARK